MTLSILIVNWNSKAYLRRCLESIRLTCASLSPQIVVVDGGSFDGCGEMLAAEFPEVDFVQCEENLGFGRANNRGFERVTGEALLLLNPDTELKDGAVALLLDELQRLPAVGIIGPRLLNTDGTLQTSCVQSLPTPINQFFDSEFLRRRFPNSFLWGIGQAFDSSTPVEVEAVSGACLLLTRVHFREVGEFNPRYFMYGEDMDLCAKSRNFGKKVYHLPGAVVMHHGGGSTKNQFSKFSTVQFCHSVALFIKTHQGRAASMAYCFLMFLSALLRLAVLFPTAWLSPAPSRARSSQKWRTILRWALGLESWVKNSDVATGPKLPLPNTLPHVS